MCGRGDIMATKIRAEITPNSPYWIEKHRYYELKHFCMQYPIWKKAYVAIDGFSKQPTDIFRVKNGSIANPTEQCTIAKEQYGYLMGMVEEAAYDTDPVIGKYILDGVIYGLSYDKLNARYGVPCCKDVYYSLYRKFFYILNKYRM